MASKYVRALNRWAKELDDLYSELDGALTDAQSDAHDVHDELQEDIERDMREGRYEDEDDHPDYQLWEEVTVIAFWFDDKILAYGGGFDSRSFKDKVNALIGYCEEMDDV